MRRQPTSQNPRPGMHREVYVDVREYGSKQIEMARAQRIHM